MSSSLALACSIFLAATPEPDLPRALVADVQAAAPLAEQARSLGEAIAAATSQTGVFRVLTSSDVRELLGLERQKQLLGCSEDSASCMTEVIDAMGGSAVLVTSSLTRLGDVYQFTLQGLDSWRGRVIGRSTRMARELPALRAAIPFMVAEATGTPAPPEPSRLGPGLLLGTGAAAIVAGGVLFFQAAFTEQATSTELRLGQTQPQVSLKDLAWYRAQAQLVDQLRIIGTVSAGVGLALAITGTVLFPKQASSGLASRLVVTPGGLAWVGVWP